MIRELLAWVFFTPIGLMIIPPAILVIGLMLGNPLAALLVAGVSTLIWLFTLSNTDI